MIDLRTMLERAASRFPDKAAIILGTRKLTFAELEEQSSRLAGSLVKLGIKKGECVATLLSTSPECVIIYFAIVKCGAVIVPLDIRYKIDELDSIIGNCQPHVLITESASLRPILSFLPRFTSVRQVINLGTEYEDRFPSIQLLLAAGAPPDPAPRLDIDDLVIICYTSGPTTTPHGSMMSHRNLCNEAKVSAFAVQQTEKDVVMLYALPIHHMFGLTTILLTSLSCGSTVVMVPGTGISISTLMEAIEKHRGTLLCGVPYIFALAIKMARREGVRHDVSSLRVCYSGGARIPIETLKSFKRCFHVYLGDMYGMTESISEVTTQPPDGSGKLGSCGKALPGWQLRIVDDDGRNLPPNVSGEIMVKGLFFLGYFNNPEATARTIENGWLHTGDYGKVDEEGNLYITGLKKRMLILKGQNIYPHDIESVLLTHPKIAAVRVVGAPDRLRGQVVKTYVRLKPGARLTKQEIKKFCLERMADYKCPRLIVFERAPKAPTA